ncbi:peroxiredoxin [Cereibacter changlensis]|jgi:peroxiredoxin|uniref:Glutathione-dependent peroxiredoxin n=1 Tax=Cereibacter changlensis TaxID=402884 RepID=A0A4U0YWS5_9RHOB|nr:peroxiredoxin [Cereibacter changlensis]MBZ4689835.1 thiol peroxidase (atypical 2-Cys peroxiredoxin) [Cereibacter sp.]TKA95066.1 peroxiredoxin [Cereibacter changlensis]
MRISVGDRLPAATLVKLGESGPEQVDLAGLTAGRNVVIFAVPGAFTPTCSSSHMPSFIRSKAAFDAKGVEEIICVSVNDPFVMKAWGEATGAAAAGITLLADAEGAMTKAMGLSFDAPPAGLIGRSHRYALQAVDGEVRVIQIEDSPGACTVSGGEALLEAI